MTREEVARQSRLILANLEAQHELTHGEMILRAPDARIALPAVKRGSPTGLTAAARRRLGDFRGVRMGQIHDELRHDVSRLRQLLRDSVRAGQARAQTVGDPTAFFCSLTANSVTDSAQSFMSANGTTFLSPIVVNNSTGLNRSRFMAVAFSPIEPFGLGLLQLTQRIRFSFLLNAACAVSVTAHLTPLGTFRTDAPDAVYLFPFWHIIPRPALNLSAAGRLSFSLWQRGHTPDLPHRQVRAHPCRCDSARWHQRQSRAGQRGLVLVVS